MRLTTIVLAALLIATHAPAQDAPPPDVWLQHGGSPQRRDDVRRVLREAVEVERLPGASLLVLHEGVVVFDESFGVADRDQRPFGTGEVCAIDAVTVPVTATLIAVLVDRDLLTLDDSVDRHLPDFSRARLAESGAPVRPPTVRELLSHTSGLPADADTAPRFPRSMTSAGLREVVDEILARGFSAEPGMRFGPSRLGYDVLARIAERVADQPFEDLVREMVLVPLGMDGATFRPSREVLAAMPAKFNARHGRAVPGRRPLGPPSAYVSAGTGLYATAQDLSRLLLLHQRDGRVGSRRFATDSTLGAMYHPQPAAPAYGLGFELARIQGDAAQRLRHGGASGVYVWLDRDADLIFIGMSQMDMRYAAPVWMQVTTLVERAFAAPSAPDTGSMVGKDPDAARRAEFTSFDRDGDGNLSRDEVPSRYERVFDRFDEDGDGSLSETEFVDGLRQRTGGG